MLNKYRVIALDLKVALIKRARTHPGAVAEGIAGVSGQAVADGSLPAGVVVSGHADGVVAARVGVAEVLLGEGAAADERVAGHVARAAADGRQAAQVTVGPDAAGSVAGVLADAVEAGRSSGRAVRVAVALRPALRVRAADVALGALAHRPVVGHRAAGGAGAALPAGRHALEVAAHVPAAAVAVALALVPAPAQRVAQVAVQAGAGGDSVDDLALGVDSARTRVALFLWGEK